MNQIFSSVKGPSGATTLNQFLETDNTEIPSGAFQQTEPFASIGRKWIAYAQKDCDANDIAAAIWSAIQETKNEIASLPRATS